MTPNRDEQMARLSLTLDEKERANLLAEHERWERRRRAMKRGDEGSPIPGAECECGPLTFAPLKCTGCDILLTRANHGNGKQCQRCFEETQAFKLESQRRFEAARQNLLVAKARSAFWLAAGWITLLLIGVYALAIGLSWALNKAAWWLGQAFP